MLIYNVLCITIKTVIPSSMKGYFLPDRYHIYKTPIVFILLGFWFMAINNPPLMVWFVVFNATFNNISIISWQSVLLVEETKLPRENHRPVASHWQTLSHNVILLGHDCLFLPFINHTLVMLSWYKDLLIKFV